MLKGEASNKLVAKLLPDSSSGFLFVADVANRVRDKKITAQRDRVSFHEYLDLHLTLTI